MINNSKQISNSNHSTEEKDISRFIDDWFDRIGNPINYIFTCNVPKCTYSGTMRYQDDLDNNIMVNQHLSEFRYNGYQNILLPIHHVSLLGVMIQVPFW